MTSLIILSHITQDLANVFPHFFPNIFFITFSEHESVCAISPYSESHTGVQFLSSSSLCWQALNMAFPMATGLPVSIIVTELDRDETCLESA